MSAPERLLTVEEHLERVLAAVRPLEAESVPLGGSRGRTLAADVTAHVDIPAFDNSAMDGFAVRFSDVAAAASADPVRLRVVADLPAGSALDPPLGPGDAVRIMTGSPVPTAADVIVPFEDTLGGLADSLGDIVIAVAPRTVGSHIRRRASDAATGDVLVTRGTLMAPLQAAAAAAGCATTVVVTRTPRIAVVSTGSELVAPGMPLRRGQIPESNSELLVGLVEEAGAAVVLRRTIADDEDDLHAVLAQTDDLGADAVIFTGGVSAGAYEVVRNALGPGGRMDFVKVAMQPGKPQGFGLSPGGALLFGLPGNPVSVAVSFEVFARPALLGMQRRTDLRRPMLRLPVHSGWRTPADRRQYLPAAIDRSDAARWTVGPATPGGSGSHLAGGLGRAEAYAVVPADVDAVEAGTVVDVMLLS